MFQTAAPDSMRFPCSPLQKERDRDIAKRGAATGARPPRPRREGVPDPKRAGGAPALPWTVRDSPGPRAHARGYTIIAHFL